MADMKPTSIVAIVLAVLIGAAGAYLLTERASEQAEQAAAGTEAAEVADKIADEIAEQSSAITEMMQSQLTSQIDGQQLAEEKARIESGTGQALARQCAELTTLHQNYGGDAALENRDEACRKYNEFVLTGREGE